MPQVLAATLWQDSTRDVGTGLEVVRNQTMIYAIGMNDDRLREAVEALRGGNDRRARRILGQVVHDNPDNIAAWWYLSAVLEDPEQKARCLRRVLELRPDHHEARELLRKLNRRSVTVTPPVGTARPVIEVVADNAGSLHTTGVDESRKKQQTSDVTVALAAVGIALAAIILTIILVVTGQAEGILGIRGPDLTPTLQPLSFNVPACTAGENLDPQIVFINNTSVDVMISKGASGEEVHLLDLEPGAQGAVGAKAGVPTRYAVETTSESYGPSGAIIEVPEHSICRVPIQ